MPLRVGMSAWKKGTTIRKKRKLTKAEERPQNIERGPSLKLIIAKAILDRAITTKVYPPSEMAGLKDERLASFVVGDSYVVQDVIGEGAYGIVWSVAQNPISFHPIFMKRATYHPAQQRISPLNVV